MTKRAIKILLALAVMIATFAVITVVASAENRLVEREGAKPYYYLDDVHYGNLFYDDIPTVIMSSSSVCYDDVYFEELCSTKPRSIFVYDSGGGPGEYENYIFYSDYLEDETFFFTGQLLYYSSTDSIDDHYFSVFILFVSNFSGFEFYPSSSGSGDSSGGSSSGGSDSDYPSDPGSSGDGSGLDSFPWYYDPTDTKSIDLSEYVNDVYSLKAYTFYIHAGVDYSYFLEEACSVVARTHLGERFDAILPSEWLDYIVFYNPSGLLTIHSEGSPFLPFSLPEGEFYLLFRARVDDQCSLTNHYICLRIISRENLSSDPVRWEEAYYSGYDDGYHEGYISGSNFKQSVINKNRDEAYQLGVDAGYDLGRIDGISSGMSSGKDIGYREGYSAGSSDGYDNGYLVGYDDGRDAGYSSGYSDCKLDVLAENIDSYTEGFNDGMSTVITNDGDAISGFFLGISASVLDALSFVDNNVTYKNISPLDLVAFYVFVMVAVFVVTKLLGKFF